MRKQFVCPTQLLSHPHPPMPALPPPAPPPLPRSGNRGSWICESFLPTKVNVFAKWPAASIHRLGWITLAMAWTHFRLPATLAEATSSTPTPTPNRNRASSTIPANHSTRFCLGWSATNCWECELLRFELLRKIPKISLLQGRMNMLGSVKIHKNSRRNYFTLSFQRFDIFRCTLFNPLSINGTNNS